MGLNSGGGCIVRVGTHKFMCIYTYSKYRNPLHLACIIFMVPACDNIKYFSVAMTEFSIPYIF